MTPNAAQNRRFVYHVIGNGTGRWDVPVGGMGAVSAALAGAATGAGVQIDRGCEVTGLDADEHGVVARTTRAPRDAFAGTLHVHESAAQPEHAHRAAAAGRMPSPMPCELYGHTLADRSILGSELAAGEAHTLTLFGLHTPYALFKADPERARADALRAALTALDAQLAEPVEDCLMKDANGRPCIEARTPLDLEQELGTDEGNTFHGALQWPWAEDDADAGTWGSRPDCRAWRSARRRRVAVAASAASPVTTPRGRFSDAPVPGSVRSMDARRIAGTVLAAPIGVAVIVADEALRMVPKGNAVTSYLQRLLAALEALAGAVPALAEIAQARAAIEEIAAIRPAIDELAQLQPALLEIAGARPAIEDIAKVRRSLTTLAGARPAIDRIADAGAAIDRIAAACDAIERIGASGDAIDRIGEASAAIDRIGEVSEAIDEISQASAAIREIARAGGAIQQIAGARAAIEEIAGARAAIDEIAAARPSIDKIGSARDDIASLAVSADVLGRLPHELLIAQLGTVADRIGPLVQDTTRLAESIDQLDGAIATLATTMHPLQGATERLGRLVDRLPSQQARRQRGIERPQDV